MRGVREITGVNGSRNPLATCRFDETLGNMDRIQSSQEDGELQSPRLGAGEEGRADGALSAGNPRMRGAGSPRASHARTRVQGLDRVARALRDLRQAAGLGARGDRDKANAA